jgi:flagellar biosynthesis GTPase FlhF
VQLAIETGVPLSYVGEGTAVESGLRPADPEVLARALARPRRRGA